MFARVPDHDDVQGTIAGGVPTTGLSPKLP
jgi:hypothetical protein